MITTLFISVISGVFASFSFYVFLRVLKPNIKISPKIARDKKEGIIKIKVVNLAKRDALDIRAELVLLVPKNVPNGIIYVRKPIELKKNYLINLSKYSKQDKNANYAFRFRANDSFIDDWNYNGQYLIFKLIAKDEVSGFSKVFIKEYFSKGDIIDGDFEMGVSMEIK